MLRMHGARVQRRIHMRKILFLDVDGVLNSKETLRKSGGGIVGIDPYLTILVHRIVQGTGCEVVLSSSWRHFDKGFERVNVAIPLISKTDRCCTGIRGAEIYKWLTDNIPWQDRKDDNYRYAILDDESDMLLWQRDHFFQTSFDTGITPEIVGRVITHLNR